MLKNFCARLVSSYLVRQCVPDVVRISSHSPLGSPSGHRRCQSHWISADPRDIESQKIRRNYGKRQLDGDLEGKIGQRIRTRRKASLADDISNEILFGTNPVLLALRAGRRKFHRLLITEAKSLSQEQHSQEILKLCAELNIPVKAELANVLRQISHDRPHQGVCLECSPLTPLDFSLSELSQQMRNDVHQKLWLVIDNIYDPMNLGAIMRSAYFFGVERMVLLDESSCPLSPIVSKASAGIMEILPIHSVKMSDIRRLITLAKESKWETVATASKNEIVQAGVMNPCPLHLLNVSGSAVVIFGNEHKGIEMNLLKSCDKVVTIEPGREQIMEGADCLNVSVAAGVLLSQIMIRRLRPAATAGVD